jgi:hypothetical protein
MTKSGAAKGCRVCGRWGRRGYRPADDGRDGWVCSNDRACAERAHAWEYGFYDSDPEGEHRYDRQNEVGRNQTAPTIWWYVFGMPHSTAASAEHTGSKSTRGQPIIVRRRHNAPDTWEHVS